MCHAMRCKAAREVEAWCVRWGFQRSMQFSWTALGECNARILARLWCVAMQYWYDLSLENSGEGFGSSRAAQWAPTEELARLQSEARGVLLERCHQITRMRPAGC